MENAVQLLADLMRRLVPATRRVDIYTAEARYLWGSGSVESVAVTALVARQLQRRAAQRNEVRGSQHVAGDHCITLLRVRDEAGELVGALACHHVENDSKSPPGTVDQLVVAAKPALRYLAVHLRDAATAPLDRQSFERHATAVLAHRVNAPSCVVYGNLDRLHLFNERMGLQACDQLLTAVGSLWREASSNAKGLAGHISGDRFVALLPGLTLNHARTWAEQLRQAIGAMPLPESCAELHLSCSLGVAPVTGGSSLSRALATAEASCRAAKDRGRDRVELFDVGDASLMQRHEDVEVFRQLTAALECGRFVLYAQPIVTLNDPDTVNQYEILLRLRREDDTVAAPDEFLSAAVRYQLMNMIDLWVMDKVLEVLSPHAELLPASQCTFWINLSGQSLAETGFTDSLRAKIRGSAVPARALAFEVTENVVIGNLEPARRCIERLRELGCDFSLDDFGTGLSSLAYLRDLNVSKLKIAGNFVRTMSNDVKSDSMVRAVVRMAQQLQLQTTAECIEDEVTARHARALGITFGQGYLFGAPVPVQELVQRLALTWRARANDQPASAASAA
jgi:diguanylate cyclase (GGDEF)-like protein